MKQEQEIRLRPMGTEDTEQIIRWRNQEWVCRNFIYQKPFTKEGHLEWIRTQVTPGYAVQFIISLPDGRDIGTVYLRDIDREQAIAEYGIFIGEKDALGRGYGTAAAGAALAYAFGRLSLDRVFLRVLADNIGARRSYEKAGFRMTDRKETVMTVQGEREVLFMEIDRSGWEEKCRTDGAETEES